MAQRKTQMRVIRLSEVTNCSNDKIIVRPPSDEEIRIAGTNPSDYQMGRIKYTSKILSDLELLPDVYNSKKAVVEKSNEMRARKIIDNINNISVFFDGTMSVKDFFVELTKSNINLYKEYEISIPALLHGVKEWNEITFVDKKMGYSEGLMMRLGTILRSIYGSDRELIQQQYNSQLFSIFKENNESKTTREIVGNKDYEPTEEEVTRMKRVYIKTLNLFTTIEKEKKFKKPAAYVNYINAIDSFNAILNEDIMSGFVCSDINIDVNEYMSQIKTYMDSVKTPGERGNTMTVMMNIATTNLKELHNTLVENGCVVGLNNIENFFEYIKIYKPYLIEKLDAIYGITEEMLSADNFASYDEFFSYFYTPEMIQKIDSIVYKRKRARIKGTLRKGAELAVDFALNEKRKKVLTERIDDNTGKKRKKGARSKADIIKLIEEKQAAREELRNLLHDSNNVSEIKEKIAKLGKDIATLKNTLKKREAEGDIVEKTDEEKILDINNQQNIILNKVRNRISSPSEVFDLKKEFNYVENTISGDDAIIGGDMFTYSFIVKTKKDEICKTIIEVLNETFNPKGDKPYNIDIYPSDDIENAKEVIVDYPKKSALYKMFIAKPDMAYNIIKLVKLEVAKRIAINPVIIADEEYIKINAPFDFISLI